MARDQPQRTRARHKERNIPELMKVIDMNKSKVSGGGSAGNTVTALSQFGGKAFYSCLVAKDDLGRLFLDDLKKEAEMDTATLVANQVLVIFTQKQTREEVARLKAGEASPESAAAPAVDTSELEAEIDRLKAEVLNEREACAREVEELARQSSAVLEQGRIGSLEKVQLWLRLAEFEHYLGMLEGDINRIAKF